jgi:hypothetical protein
MIAWQRTAGAALLEAFIHRIRAYREHLNRRVGTGGSLVYIDPNIVRRFLGFVKQLRIF